MTDRVVTGTTAIARALGICSKTVQRMIADGRLKAYRTGDHTSPWRCQLSEIERIRHIGVSPAPLVAAE